MPNKKKGKSVKKANTEGSSTIVITPQVSTEVKVSSQPVPFTTEDKKIHERQKLPALLQGDVVPDEKPTGFTKPEE